MSAAGHSLSPDPCRLWDLWEMYQTYADRLAGMVDLVSAMAVALGADSEFQMDPELAEEMRGKILRCVELCIALDLPVSADAFAQLAPNFYPDEAHGWPREQQVRFR